MRTRLFLYRLKKTDGNVVTVFRQNVKNHPDKVVFYFEDQIWTFKQLEQFSNQVAITFVEQGFKAGDEVALLMDSRPEYVGIWLGLAKAGIIAALLNTNQRSKALVHSVTVIKCKAFIFGPEYADAVSQIVSDIREKTDDMRYYCMGKLADNSPDVFKRLDLMIRDASSDASLIEHRPGFTGQFHVPSTPFSPLLCLVFPISLFSILL